MTQREPTSATKLSRRERQIMDVVYALERATVNEVRDQLPDPPSYSGVRALMRILEEKGHLEHVQEGPRYVFFPTVSADQARRSALRHLLATFFDGSMEGAVAALLDLESHHLSEQDFDRLSEMIDAAKREGR